MRIVLTVLILIISPRLVAQDTKKIAISSDTPPYEELYYVLRNDNTIKHGEYKKSYGDRLIKGKFDNNKRIGIWDYLDRNGEPELRIDFDNQKVLINKPFTFVDKFMIEKGDSLKDVKLEEEPIFLGGRGNILYYLLGLQYPVQARREGIQGTVLVSATITKEGKIIDEKVESGPSPVLNNEALRVIQLMPNEWLPGKVNGDEVDIRIFIPVKFKLN
jgi:periplasmic protein TonB